MSAGVDWDAAVARFYNTGESESDRGLGPSPKQPGCRAPAHFLRAYGYSGVGQTSGTEARAVRQGKTNGAVDGANTALGRGAAPPSKVLSPPILLQQIDAWARQVLGDRNLPASATKVAWIISLYLNREKGTAWPSVQTIACRTAITDRTVYTALDRLEAGGHLARRAGGGRTSNHYQLMLRTERVKDASSSSETGFTPPVKRASPEPLTEPLIEPHAQRGAADEEIDQEKRNQRRYSDNQNIVRKNPETIKREVREWARNHISYTKFDWTWQTARQAVLASFEQVYRIAPYPPAVREPRDMGRIDEWQRNGWDPSTCVLEVQGTLVNKLLEGDPVASEN